MRKTIVFMLMLNLFVIIVFGVYITAEAKKYNEETSLVKKEYDSDLKESDKEDNAVEEEKKEEPELIKHIPTDLEIAECNAVLKFAGRDIQTDNKVLFGSSRIYLPLDFIEKIGGSYINEGEIYTFFVNNQRFKAAYEGNTPDTLEKIIYVNEVPYILLNTFSEKANLIPTIDSKNNFIDFYKKGKLNTDLNTVSKASVNAEKAYLRLEDIMPDGDNPNGDFDDEGLEKLRIVADYLKLRNQEFYVAWIPVYVNPELNITNDLSASTSLYNADFIYTLDYLAERGGHIGLHGLTHQYGAFVSADGYEFGDISPWSTEEKEQRLIKASKIARYLRIKCEFFEFPHYGATYDDYINAEKYFDIIYENNPFYYSQAYNIYKIDKDGKSITYVPTPADYVYSEFGLTDILDKLSVCKENGMEVSLFFHPRLDFKYINSGLDENDRELRNFHYSDYAILPSVVDKVIEMGNSFSEIE